jgi:hypothetical protein
MSVESPPAFLQSGTYSAEKTRRAIFAWAARTAANNPGIIAGGLISSGDLQLTAPVSGLSVNVGPGECIIGGNEGGAQGGYYARNSSTTNLGIGSNSSGLPRIDTVVATVADSGYTAPTDLSGDQWSPAVVLGTATSGATLANLSGAATVPGSSLVLGYVLVPNGAANIITADLLNSAKVATLGLPGVGGTTVARAYSGTATTINASPPVKIVLDTVSFDPYGNFDVTTNHRYNVPATGYYLVNAHIEATSSAYGLSIQIYKNGSAYSANTNGGATAGIWPTISDIIPANAGDYFEVWASASANGATLATAGTSRNWLAVARVG